jgi:ATP-dependent RNA helicase DeaD
MEQRQREEVIRGFKKGSLETLIATDVAARGLDVSDVSHVFNYHIPFDSESYVHRIGRTGRAGKSGVAISIVTPHEFNSLKKIQKSVGSKLESKVIPTISDVQMKQKDKMLDKIKTQAISNIARELIEELKKEFVDEDIALKLASIMYSENDIQGSDKIGKTQNEVSKLFARHKQDRNSGGRGRGGRGGRNGGGRSRGGYRGNNSNRRSNSGSNSNSNYKGNNSNKNSKRGDR